MTYKAYLKQYAEGCDYTIGCAQTVIEIEAKNINEAKQKLFEEIQENYTWDKKLEFCELYEIKKTVICNLKEWYNQIYEAANIIENKRKEDLERKEYERLKLKFGKS
jgi:hypothetical protein